MNCLGDPDTGDLDLATQADVDAVTDCNTVTGDLRISGAFDNLAALSELREVEGSLDIGPFNLPTLAGLEGLTTVRGTVRVHQGNDLRELRALDRLSTLGNLVIEDNPGISNEEALPRVPRVEGDLIVINNAVLPQEVAEQWAAGVTANYTKIDGNFGAVSHGEECPWVEDGYCDEGGYCEGTRLCGSGTDREDCGVCEDPCGVWSIGEDGEMRGIRDNGTVKAYPFEEASDLFAIACKGARQAWVAGADGSVLRSDDLGQHWTRLPVQASGDLRAIATTRTETIYAAGDAGVLLVSPDLGDHWTEVSGPAIDWSDVYPTDAGVFLAGLDGSLWRYDPASAEFSSLDVAAAMGEEPVPLRSVSATDDGRWIVAVGTGGLIVESADQGESWRRIEVATEHDLTRVQVGHDEPIAFVVGAGGTLVTLFGEAVVHQIADDSVTLHGIHINHHGEGTVVGEHGLLMMTEDWGFNWTTIDTGTTKTLYDVDALDELHL